MKRGVFLIGLVVLLSACEDVNRQSSVPNVPVNYTVYITREYPHFVIANGFQAMTVTQKTLLENYIGYAGLLIWVGMDENYHAADLCCPYCVKRLKRYHPLHLYHHQVFHLSVLHHLHHLHLLFQHHLHLSHHHHHFHLEQLLLYFL